MTDINANLTQQLAEQVFPDLLEGFDRTELKKLAQQHGTPLLVINEQQIVDQFRSLQTALPNVQLHYAIKALSDKNVLACLHDLGCHFDIATNGEIDLLKSIDVSASNCIHTHPIKKDREIRYCLDYGCRFFVVDNIDEVNKFIPYADQVELILRINFRNQDAIVDLSKKFGCQLDKIPELIDYAQSKNLRISGLSFHVGSQVPSPYAHVNAIGFCAEIINNMPGVNWKFIDIGGGFPIEYSGPVMSIKDFCEPINEVISLLPVGIKVLAEPGRFIAGPSAIQIMSVVGKAQRGSSKWYYLDDGVYGSLSGQIYDHAKYPISLLQNHEMSNKLLPSVLAGPTCDSIDVIDENIDLPELQIGDYLVASQIGAYSISSATEFNQYAKPKVHWLAKRSVVGHSEQLVNHN